MLNIYFLFLIKDKVHNINLWKKYFKNSKNYKIIIHPKNKEKIVYIDKNEIVLNPIETKWGDISLVDAEINLLKKALEYKNKNSYYILLSGDSLPLSSYKELYNFLGKQSLSFFNYRDYILGNRRYKNKFKFSSQFFCVNFKDANIVVNNYEKYKNKFINFKEMYSPDETFMLSTLYYENKLYKFIDRKIIVTTMFYYRNTIQEIDSYVKSYNNIMKFLYELKESNNLSDIRKETFHSLKKFKEYGISHPYLFLYNEKLIKSYKNKFKESFFIRKVTSNEDDKNI